MEELNNISPKINVMLCSNYYNFILKKVNNQYCDTINNDKKRHVSEKFYVETSNFLFSCNITLLLTTYTSGYCFFKIMYTPLTIAQP